MNVQRRLLSQNFLKDQKLVAHLVGLAHFGPQDTVIDIGAGRGIITEELAKVCGQVLAVELDLSLAVELKDKFKNNSKVEIFNDDIHHFLMPNYPYKVFSNLPFHITADIIYKLTYYAPPPEEAYLIVQKEAGEKFSGLPLEAQSSLLLKPWFDFAILYTFRKTDFIPRPEVEVILLKMTKRSLPLVSAEEDLLYERFIKYSFGRNKDLKRGLKDLFSYNQWKRLARDNNFSLHVHPGQLTFPQWLKIFRFLAQSNNSKDLLFE